MCNVLNPLQLRHHLFLFLQVLLILLAFVYFVLFKLFLNLVDLLVEKPADIGFLFNQNLGRFVLDGPDVVQNLLVEFCDILHSISITLIQRSLAPKLSFSVLYFILQFFDNLPILNLSLYESLLDDDYFFFQSENFITRRLQLLRKLFAFLMVVIRSHLRFWDVPVSRSIGFG